MTDFLNTAKIAAHAAGECLLQHASALSELTVTSKGLNDFVSEADKEAEAIILDIIRNDYPEHGFLAEETGLHAGNAYQWIIDPLDGTTNFLHGIPHWAVSIALKHGNNMLCGVVLDPSKNELFSAAQNQGAQLNGKPISVSQRSDLSGALLGTGIPFRDMSVLEPFIKIMRAFVHANTAGVRRPGAAALDFCWLAAGRFDAFWEYGLSPWDMAAGALIVQEAGGQVTTFDNESDFLQAAHVAASNNKLHTQFLEVINSARSEAK